MAEVETEDDAVEALGMIPETSQQIFVFLIDLVTQVARREADNGMVRMAKT